MPAASARRKLAFRHDVDASPQSPKRFEHGLVRIGFHRIANQRIDILERCGEDLVVPFERCCGIDIARGANGLGNV